MPTPYPSRQDRAAWVGQAHGALIPRTLERGPLLILASLGERDKVDCGDGGGDVAVVDLNGVVDGEVVGSVLDAGNLVGTIGTCDRVEARILQ